MYAPAGTGSPVRHRTPRGRATALLLRHSATLGSRRGAAAELGERGASKGALQGTVFVRSPVLFNAPINNAVNIRIVDCVLLLNYTIVVQ